MPQELEALGCPNATKTMDEEVAVQGQDVMKYALHLHDLLILSLRVRNFMPTQLNLFAITLDKRELKLSM